MKTFVLDTNVILYDAEAIERFPNHDIFLPLTVFEELNRKKKQPHDVGHNARTALRFINILRKTRPGNLLEGIQLENGSRLFLFQDTKEHQALIHNLPSSVYQNKIILAAYILKEKGLKVTFISKDFVSIIKAETLGIQAENYESFNFSYHKIYPGLKKFDVDKNTIDSFFKDGFTSFPEEEFLPNEYILMKSAENSSAIGRFVHKEKLIKPLLKMNHDIWGIHPLNMEQKCALDMLLRDDINLITLVGKAGTGKTLLALAAGLRKVLDEAQYKKILISRPIIPLGKDIGYLPGSKEEKLTHWMQPLYDNLEFLCRSSEGEPNDTLRWVLDSKKIEMEAVTYIRGRSLPKMYIIIDEAQNLTPHEVKTIISRAGHNTKVILTGDPTQIDNPYLDRDSNGLTYIIGKFQGQSIFGHIRLEKTERSELAGLATKLLN